jgi:hypothetical protein
VIGYALKWHHKKDAPLITEYLHNHNMQIPTPYAPLPVKRPKKKIDVTKLVREEVRRELGLLRESGFQLSSKNRKALPVSREESIKPLHTRVNQFVFHEPIQIDHCWNWLRELFEERNGITVKLAGNQTFPQWLHSTNYMDIMMFQLQGYFDYMHDALSNGGN